MCNDIERKCLEMRATVSERLRQPISAAQLPHIQDMLRELLELNEQLHKVQHHATL